MIIVDRVSRRFRNGSFQALSDISFCVKSGESIGIIGKNGAGKTTLLKLIAGILIPSSGFLWTFQKEAWKAIDKNRKKIGFLSAMQNKLVYANTLGEACQYQKMLYQIKEKDYAEMFELVGIRLGVHNYMDVPYGRLSVGEQRRGEFLLSLLHKPQLLLLDEPTIGLDEQNRQIFNETVCYLNQDMGITIVTSSHDLQSLQQTSRRVLLLQEGRMAFDGRWELLSQKVAPWRCVTFNAIKPIDLEDIPIHHIEYENGRIKLMFRENAISIQSLHTFLTKKTEIHNFQIEKVEIERIIYEILKGGMGM